VVLVVCCSQQPERRWPPHMDTGNPPFWASFGARQVHTEEYYVILLYYIHTIIIIMFTKHTTAYKASNTISQLHNSATVRASNPRTANKQQGRGSSYSIASSVGTASPARKPLPLTRAYMPPLARYIGKLPLHRPTLSSRRVPATKDARVMPPGPAA
jgi:hypothetical protein